MGNMFAIIGIGKLKAVGNIKGMLDHMTRRRETINSNGRENITMIKPPALPEIMREINSYIPRKNAVLAYDTLLTASPEFFTGKSDSFIMQWAETSLQWACNKFGTGNIKGAVLHLDETTPHIQLLIIPEHENRLNARYYTGGREKMRELWTQYAQAVKCYGLQRGREFSPAEHKDIKSYYADIRRGAELAAGRQFSPDELPAPTMSDRINPAKYAAKLINRVAIHYRKQNGNLKAALEATRAELEQVTNRAAVDGKQYQQLKENPEIINELKKELAGERRAKEAEQAKYKKLLAAVGEYFQRNIGQNDILRTPEKLGALQNFPELQKEIALSLTPDVKPRRGMTLTRGF